MIPAEKLQSLIDATNSTTTLSDTNFMIPAEKLQSLIDAANSTTTLSDDNMTDAVESLISGYGKGGGKTATVTITAPTGSTVTLTDGIETLTTVETDGVWVFSEVPYGIWTIVCYLRGSIISRDIGVVKDLSERITLETFLLRGSELVDYGPYDVALSLTAGKVSVNKNVTKFGHGSLRCVGYPLYCYLPEIDPDSDWTLEFWVYTENYPNYTTLFYLTSDAETPISLYVHHCTAEFTIRLSSGSNRRQLNPEKPALATWHHYAFIRKNAEITAYIDGISVGTVTGWNSGIPYRFGIGAFTQPGSVNPTVGNADSILYIESLRISSYAVYNGDFAPPNYCFGWEE